jgi:hypothetical protein
MGGFLAQLIAGAKGPNRGSTRVPHGCDSAVHARMSFVTRPEEVAVSMTDVREDESGIANVKNVDLKFEAVVIPVSDVDRAKEFYLSLGWRLDADFPFDNGSGSSSSPRPGPAAPSNSAPTSPRRRPAQRKACT